MFASFINNLFQSARINTKRVVLSTNQNGLRDLDTVLLRVRSSPDLEKNDRNMALMLASIGEQLRNAYEDWTAFSSKYEVTVFCNDSLENSTSYRMVLLERANGFDREFDFAL